ncbi:sodium/proton antiporter, CPA1 family [Filimonas lacunae]|uniref:Sodium/proton antiporter, CPA1 family n=1 Tax=Filimonas lacunae TaxID=477680 RepID=A0A173MLY8_9BACT|nr:sodium:proton antiporter [Filimonas lacunae]BAV08497.1 Na+/H+ antiporter NhaP [Filimonas lacunae]SIT34016.1 sodium/proton antiporter, CPA1 family [Filimonas lacunae]
MNLYNTFSIVIVLAAVIAYLNQKLLRLPSTIGVMIIAIFISLVLILCSNLFPSFFQDSIALIDSVDFSKMLTGAVLSFLLFAGTIQIRIDDLKNQKLSVLLFSTISVILSTVIVGLLLYLLLQLLGIPIALLHCFLFGALISPTDPVSVLAILKNSGISKSLETKIAGESLLNDGVALVIFFSILHAIRNPDDPVTLTQIAQVFAREALGGLALGLVLGYVGSWALKSIDNYKIEVMITLAIVMGGYNLAGGLGVSGPLTMVSAGIIIGNYGKSYAMSDISRDYLDKFWELIEEILNIMLFALIGFELLLIKHFTFYWTIGLSCIVIVLVARFISIAIPAIFIRLQERLKLRTVLFLTWGGLRGGVSIALALTLTRGLHKDLFLFITYCVVVFSVVVQGLSIERFTLRRKKKLSTVEN